MKSSVYLAGPIKGQSYHGAINWRDEATRKLQPQIEAFSPLRGKEFLEQHITIFGESETSKEHPLLVTKGLIARDHHDVMVRDAILMNLLGAPRVSIGSVFELAWAYHLSKPLVLIIEPKDELRGMAHDHDWIITAAPFVVNTLDDGIDVIKAILLPNPGSTALGYGDQ